MRPCYRMTWFLLALLCKFFVTATSQELPFCTDNESGSGALQASGSVHPSCIPITRDSELEISSRCFPFFPEGKCLTFNYHDGPEDFVTLSLNLNFLDETLSASPSISDYCKEALRAYVCNYVYPGCDPLLGQPQGICESDCISLTTGECEKSFMDIVRIAETSNVFRLKTMCNNTLDFVEASNSDLLFNSSMNCWNITGVINETSTVSSTSSPNPNNVSSGSSSNFVRIVTSVSSGIFLLAAGMVLISYLYVKRRKRQRRRAMLMFANATNLNGGSHILSNIYHFDFSLEDLTHIQEHDYDQVEFFHLTAEDATSVGTHLHSALVSSKQLEITGDLGEGAFGRVYKGIFTQIMDDGTCADKQIPVAVKTIKNWTSYPELKGFLLESALMSTFSHPHVLGLTGICLDNHNRSPLLILPFMENGDLKSYLKGKREIATKTTDCCFPEGLSYHTLIVMCYQISCGMEYLASRKLVHRDLAARNCMIDAKLQVKVADFGLTRDIYQTDYYRQKRQGRVPIKWMSPESLHDRISNEKTDVWSYGVTCWEVFSLGRSPYPTISNHEVADYLEQGNRLKKPALCSDEMYALMCLCWEEDPNQRPVFTDIVKRFSDLIPEEEIKSNQFASRDDESVHSGSTKSRLEGDSLLSTIMTQQHFNCEDNLPRHEHDEYIEMQSVKPISLLPIPLDCSHPAEEITTRSCENTKQAVGHEYDLPPEQVEKPHYQNNGTVRTRLTSNDTDYLTMNPVSPVTLN